MIRKLIGCAALAAFAGVGACEDALVVENPNDPPTRKVLATAEDAEALLGSYFKRWHEGVYSSTSNPEARFNVWAFQNFSSLANNCQNSSYPFGAAFINNTPGAGCTGENNRTYIILGEVNRVASSVLRAMDGLEGDSLLFDTPARAGRARSFGEFLRAMSLGYVALMYDSAAIVSVQTDPTDPGVLKPHTELMDSAYAAFARAIAIAEDPLNSPPYPGGFPIPVAWIPNTLGDLDATAFVRLIRSYRARIRASVARTPTERAAADWAAIMADAAAGFTADHEIMTGTTAGGFANISWRQQYNSFSTWHQMPPFIIGMADNSGRYADWLALPLGERGAGNTGFFMTTPDLRWPQGSTRSAQNSDFGVASCTQPATKCKRYFVNRSAGNDQYSGAGWGWSNYDFARYRSWNNRGDAGVARVGAAPIFTLAELDLLRAEGHIRLGQFSQAAALINNTRTRGMLCRDGTSAPAGCTTAQTVAWGGGLPAITVFDNTSPVPGGITNCVPKVPQPPGFTTVFCGNMFEAMKWEKRMETGFTHWLSWYLDSRGWGDLALNTPLWLPVPFGDWQARGKPTSAIYHTGAAAVGAAAGSAAPRGNYGW